MKNWLTILTISILLSSCNIGTPASFWTDFNKDFLTHNFSKQKSRGGYRCLHWVSTNKNTFTVKEILDYASKKGWTFTDSLSYTSSDLLKWYKNNTPIFSVTLANFAPTNHPPLSIKDYPRWIDSDLTLFKFKTGWLFFYPKTNDATEENGFILISKDKNKMTLYHLWGE